jgi:hypothetical protein
MLDQLLRLSQEQGFSRFYCALASSNIVVISRNENLDPISASGSVSILESLVASGHVLIDLRLLQATRFPPDTSVNYKQYVTLNIIPVSTTKPSVQAEDMISILFLAADPTDASRLRLGEELREIQEKLQLARLRERFELHQKLSVRPMDVSQAMLDICPQIVHFSGHGTTTGALCFENQIGGVHPIQPEALAALFEQFANQVNCVLLNACYSETQAIAIAEHIEHVVGMNQAIGDRAAISFATGFYQALGSGRTIEQAFKLGCVQIQLQGIPEHLTPLLIKKGNK